MVQECKQHCKEWRRVFLLELVVLACGGLLMGSYGERGTVFGGRAKEVEKRLSASISTIARAQ